MALSRGKGTSASEPVDVHTGAKRKRVASTNENSYTTPRPTRAIGSRFKRRRSVKEDSSDDDLTSHSVMDIDDDQDDNSSWLSDGSQMDVHSLDDCMPYKFS